MQVADHYPCKAISKLKACRYETGEYAYYTI